MRSLESRFVVLVASSLSIIILLGQASSVSGVFWPCESSSECSSVVATTFCNDQGYCECPAGRVFSEDVSECLTESLHGEDCQQGVQCSHMLTGAVCSSGKCTCREGLTYLQGRCRTLAPLDSECQVTEDCAFGWDRESVVCHENKCQCADGFYQRTENVCRRILYNAGDVCTINADCQGLGPNHRCNNFKCEYTEQSEAGRSRDQNHRTLGVQTSIDLPKSQSSVGVNTSIDIPEEDAEGAQQRDDEDAKFGDPCEENGLPCPGLSHSECRRKQCQCRPGYYPRNGLCFAELGEYADSSSLCGTTYRDGRCACRFDQFYQDNLRTCIKTVDVIGNSCTQQSQCSPFGDAFCAVTCKCHEYAVEDKAQQLCVRRVGYKQFCTKSEDCAGVPNTDCDLEKSTCVCKTGYFEENETCRPGISAQCSVDSECGVENSECVQGGGEVQPVQAARRIQETIAEEAEDELEESDIDEEVVNERTGLLGEIEGGGAKRKRPLRKQVSVTIVTGGSSSASSSPLTVRRISSVTSRSAAAADDTKTCQCKKNFVAKGDKECVEVAKKYGDPCTTTEQCTPLLGEMAECDPEEGTCGCKEEAHFNYERCNKKVLLGDTCKRVSECFVEEATKEEQELVQCRNAKCQCDFSSVLDVEQRKCVPVKTKNSSGRPSPLKVITLLLIASAVFVTTAAIRDALSRQPH